MAKPEGIRKVLAEQSTEGAIIYLAEKVEEMYAEFQKYKQPSPPVVEEAPKVEEV